MISYNTRTLSLLTALFSSLALLNACDGKRDRPELANGLTTFDVSAIEIKEAEALPEPTNQSNKLVRSNDDARTFFFQACMIDRLNRAPILSADFSVSDGYSEKPVRTDEVTGCFVWTEVHKFTPLSAEKVLRIKRTFIASGAFTGRLELELGFNPRAKQVTDLRKLTPKNIEPQVRSLTFNSHLQLLDVSDSDRSMLKIADLSLQFKGHQKDKTVINELLTLKLSQRFLMQVVPQFVHANLDNTMEEIGVRGGSFRVTMLVFPEDVYDHENGRIRADRILADNLVAELDNEAQAIYSGVVERDVTIKIHDIAAAQNRNFAIIVIKPLGELARHAETSFFYGQIPPMQGNDLNIKVRPVLNLEQKLKTNLDVALNKANKSMTGVQYLAQNFKPAPKVTQLAKKMLEKKKVLGSQVVAPAPVAGFALAQANQRYYQDYADLASYCNVIYSESDVYVVPETGFANKVTRFFGKKTEPARKYCARAPEKMVKIELRNVVEKVHEVRHVPLPPRERSIQINRSNTISWNNSTSFAQSASIGGEIGASAGVNVNPLAGVATNPSAMTSNSVGLGASVKASVGANYTISRAYSTGEGTSATLSEAQTLTVFSDTYEIDATVKRCVIIQGVGKYTGVYQCAERSGRLVKPVKETYHLVNHAMSNSLMNDNDSSSGSVWRLTIRGDEKLKQFEELLTTGNSIISMDRFMWFGGLDTQSALLPLLSDVKVTQDLPGALRAD